MNKKITITMFGGAGTVTGSNFVLDLGTRKVMVDCGMEQGLPDSRERNQRSFDYDASGIATLFVTHAHLDHIGRIPKLVHEGFSGTIYSTEPTRDLAALIFDDALHIMHDDFVGKGIEPLYSEADVTKALSLWKTVEYGAAIDAGDGVSVRYKDAGHILGSGMVEFSRSGTKLVLTGDLGNSPSPILRDAESIAGTNYLLMESVYGDRNHESRDARRDFLRQTIENTRARKGVLLIPAFSIERTQVLLYELDQMVDSGKLDPLPIFIDAPLGSKVTDVYRKYPQYYNDEAKKHLERDSDLFSFKGLTVVDTAQDSEKIEATKNPKIIIAGAGMSHGGRIRNHEKTYIEDTNATILFSGYQAAGSLGRRLQDGAKKVLVDDEWHTVRAHMATLSGYSAHKGRDELVSFVEESADTLEKVLVCLGEPRSALFLTQRLREFLGVDAVAPAEGESFSFPM
jgi:metallo-beta-lactamase family protein